ncbi:MAG: hypothetical protein RLZZ28_83 [Bacteroidota bacterium]
MNYLAHAYLSFHIPEILAGNMVSDFVKGKKKYDYPVSIQKGIHLHRAIDGFTDQHPATKKAKEFFKPAVGPYAGAFIDVVYDHFLALDKEEFPADQLDLFTKEAYGQLDALQSFFPEKFAAMFPYMKSQNWLFNYRYKEGIEKSFGGLVRRAQYLTDAQPAYRIFLSEYDALSSHYVSFFPEVKAFASSQLALLLNQ